MYIGRKTNQNEEYLIQIEEFCVSFLCPYYSDKCPPNQPLFPLFCHFLPFIYINPLTVK